MDTQNPATIEIPNFKLAKVGKDRERKRGAAGWLNGGRGAGSGFSGAVGGTGAGGGLFGLGAGLTKALLILLVSGIVSAGAWQFGKMAAAKNNVDQKSSGSKLFADKDGGKYADTSDVIKETNSIPNSLGYVSGSTDGLTPEERAKKAAEAEAARKAAEEAQKKADAEAAAKQPETPKSNVDANAVAESAVAKKGLTPGKFGNFGASLGSGSSLSGGSGLSGGINRNFGAATGLGTKGQNGTMSAFRGSSKPSSTSAPKSLISKSNSKGFAKRQLDNAFAQSRQATAAGKGETAASSAAAPFDNNPGGGNVIAGPGVGNTTSGNSGTSTTPNPTNTGGPTGNSSSGAACQADYAPDVNGNCQPITSSGPKNAAPWQSLVNIAEGIMALICVLSLIAMLCRNSIDVYSKMVVAIITAICAVLGAILVGIGATILSQYGQKPIGGIITAVGGVTIAMAAVYYFVDGFTMVMLAASELVIGAAGALATSQASKSQLQ